MRQIILSKHGTKSFALDICIALFETSGGKINLHERKRELEG